MRLRKRILFVMRIMYVMIYSKNQVNIFMRITINLPEKLNENLKMAAANRKMSVSGLVAEAIEQYLIVQRRRALGQKALDLVGKVRVALDIHEVIDEGRRDDRT